MLSIASPLVHTIDQQREFNISHGFPRLQTETILALQTVSGLRTISSENAHTRTNPTARSQGEGGWMYEESIQGKQDYEWCITAVIADAPFAKMPFGNYGMWCMQLISQHNKPSKTTSFDKVATVPIHPSSPTRQQLAPNRTFMRRVLNVPHSASNTLLPSSLNPEVEVALLK